MSFSSQKGEFDRFFNRLDRPVEESRPDRQPDRPVDPTSAGRPNRFPSLTLINFVAIRIKLKKKIHKMNLVWYFDKNSPLFSENNLDIVGCRDGSIALILTPIPSLTRAKVQCLLCYTMPVYRIESAKLCFFLLFLSISSTLSCHIQLQKM